MERDDEYIGSRDPILSDPYLITTRHGSSGCVTLYGHVTVTWRQSLNQGTDRQYLTTYYLAIYLTWQSSIRLILPRSSYFPSLYNYAISPSPLPTLDPSS